MNRREFLKPLAAHIDSEWRFQSHVENLFEDAKAGGEVGTATVWEEWLTAGGEEVQDDIRRSIEEWLDEDADGSDWENADLNGLSGRGDALQFYREERDADYFITRSEGDVDNLEALQQVALGDIYETSVRAMFRRMPTHSGQFPIAPGPR